MILIITIKGDLHAMRIQHCLLEKGYKDCHILECDRIATDHSLYWLQSLHDKGARIRLGNGTTVSVSEVELIWWRRVRADQQIEEQFSDIHQLRLIHNDCRGALGGILEASFRGTWLSDPSATDRASNKIYQLSIAHQCGFRITDTLISQSREEVKAFSESHPGGVIVKPVVGTAGPLMYTEFVGDTSRFEDRSFQICPAVYQEYISGTRHIRLNCFGDHSYAAVIESLELDWRPNLNVPVKAWDVPGALHKKVRGVLDSLGLEMGVIDIKQTEEGEFVWLEVNPQGQFLFLEPLTGLPLSEIFAGYLLDLINTGKNRNRGPKSRHRNKNKKQELFKERQKNKEIYWS